MLLHVQNDTLGALGTLEIPTHEAARLPFSNFATWGALSQQVTMGSQHRLVSLTWGLCHVVTHPKRHLSCTRAHVKIPTHEQASSLAMNCE